MNKKRSLLLFAKTSVDKGLANPAKLSDLLSQTGKVDASWAYFDDLIYSVSNDQVGLRDHRNSRDITDYDIVYFRYWGAQEGHAIAAARICKLLGVPFVDEETLRPGSQNKITQYVNLHEAKVPIPRSLIAPGPLLKETYQAYGFDFPFIMKDKGGTRGEGNYLVRSAEQMDEIIDADPSVTYVLQEFLPNDGDYRVIVTGDEVRMIIRRTAAGDSHLNNTSKGGKAEIVPLDTLPSEVLDNCIRASQFYKRQITGVDIVHSTSDNQYYCFEINRAPQVENASFEHEKAEILADYLSSF